MNDPLFLNNSFGKLGRVLPASTEEKIQEQIKEYVVSKCKEDEYEYIGVANLDLWKIFRMSLGHALKKSRPSRDSVLEFWSSEDSCSEKDSILLHLCL